MVPASTSGPGIEDHAPPTVNALIVDRQPLFLAALASLLEAPPICAEVISATRSDVALELVRTRPLDILFCEISAEPLSGVDLVRTLQAEGVRVPVVLLGEEGEERKLVSAVGLNAAGAFSKSSALNAFLVGVKAVLAGHRAIAAEVLLELLERPAASPAAVPANAGQLSPTELAILAMIGQAQSIPTIAASRGISHKTVRNHLAKIYRKLELHGRTEAVLWAARMGLTDA